MMSLVQEELDLGPETCWFRAHPHPYPEGQMLTQMAFA